MRALRLILVGGFLAAVPLALSYPVAAAQPAPRQILLLDPFGEPVVMISPTVARPMVSSDPLARMVAEQVAMMEAAFANIETLPAIFDPFLPIGVGADLLGSCTRTITYRMDASGSKPVVQVSQTGDACGPAPTVNGPTIPAAMPASGPQQPLIRVGYPQAPAAATHPAPLRG